MIEERKIISQRIGELKKEKKWTLDDLAKYSSIPRSTLHRILNEPTIAISVSNIDKLAKAFNVSPTYLIGYSNRENYYNKEDNNDYINLIIKKLHTGNFCEKKLEDIYDYIVYVESKGDK